TFHVNPPQILNYIYIYPLIDNKRHITWRVCVVDTKTLCQKDLCHVRDVPYVHGVVIHMPDGTCFSDYREYDHDRGGPCDRPEYCYDRFSYFRCHVQVYNKCTFPQLENTSR